ncbi:MAG: rod shape-determining protein MreD [Granulosicoccus sp.]
MRWLIASSIIFVLLLSVIPLPFELREWRPEFVALLVVYWATYSPQHFGVFTAWVCGILLDIVCLNPLGQSALGLIVVAYISHLSYQRIRSYVLWQQSAWAFVLVGVYQLFSNWVSSLAGKNIETMDFLGATLLTSLLWPLVVVVLRKMKIRFRLL